jgi:arylsulfatase A-like enzyme
MSETSSPVSADEVSKKKPSSSCLSPSTPTNICSHGDHGIPFLGEFRTPVGNPHNEPYRVPFMIYNPRIKNPEKKKIEGNYYSLSIPTTILDLMNYTGSFNQVAQRTLASQFMAKYEHSQSLLRPVNETMRFFTVDPGGGSWIVDNGRNLRVIPVHD